MQIFCCYSTCYTLHFVILFNIHMSHLFINKIVIGDNIATLI
jgi:hypothetical protein